MFRRFDIVVLLALLSFSCSSARKTEQAQTSRQLPIEEEAPPPAEPPYPGAESGSFAADPSMLEIEGLVETTRPVRVDDEGNYYYGTDVARPTPLNHQEIAQPKGTTVKGEFLYLSDKKPAAPVGHADIEQPILTTTRGEYHYRLDEEPAKAGASLRFGTLSPPSLSNRDNGATFKDLYSSTSLPVVFVDYDWRLFTSFGRLSLKFGSGFTMASGKGRFKTAGRATDPVEQFTFVLFPNQLTASYKLQFADRQILVPYVEGGGGYFTFAEIRDDARRPKFGGSPVAIVAGGANFLLDWIDPSAIRELDATYGINHLWLTAEIRQIVGLRKDLDFSSTSINGGFLMEF